MDMEGTNERISTKKKTSRETREERANRVSTFLCREQFAWIGQKWPPTAEVVYEFHTAHMAEAFEKFAVEFIAKEMRIPRIRAEKEFMWWNLSYGIGKPETE